MVAVPRLFSPVADILSSYLPHHSSWFCATRCHGCAGCANHHTTKIRGGALLRQAPQPPWRVAVFAPALNSPGLTLAPAKHQRCAAVGFLPSIPAGNQLTNGGRTRINQPATPSAWRFPLHPSWRQAPRGLLALTFRALPGIMRSLLRRAVLLSPAGCAITHQQRLPANQASP